MTISPIEERYGRPVIREIFEQQNRLNYMLKVEIAISEAQMKNKVIPECDLKELKEILKVGVDIKRMSEIEKETKHDIMAFIRTIEVQSHDSFKFLHFGITSNDIIDSATALQIKDYCAYLAEDIKAMQASLIEKIEKHKGTAMLGRTHGQHASPITFGLKLSTYLGFLSLTLGMT